MSTTVIINIAVAIFCSVLSLVFIICTVVVDNLKIRLNRLFVWGLFINIILMISTALTFYSNGRTEPVFFVTNFVGYLGTFIIGYVLIIFFADYINTYLSTKIKIKRTPVYIIYAVCGLGILITLFSLTNNMFFSIDESNLYRRGNMYWLAQVIMSTGIILSVFQGIKHRKLLNRMEKFALYSHIVIPIIAFIIQLSFYGFVSSYIGVTVVILIIYLGMQTQYPKTIKEKELELERSRTAIMLSQIQPHFVYNTLGTISYLCDHDAQTAKEATVVFSDFLRNNLDSIGNTELIPFQTELVHVKNYLWIEKLRFGEKLNIEYDLKAEDFLLPSLTLQPLVENAVRYGVTKKRNGGTVKIATNETESDFIIIISDDGLGFNTDTVKEDGRTHIGISNVRTRVEIQTGGMLEVKSSEESGTEVTIKIPKKGVAK